jgi:hypothetical protein
LGREHVAGVQSIYAACEWPGSSGRFPRQVKALGDVDPQLGRALYVCVETLVVGEPLASKYLHEPRGTVPRELEYDEDWLLIVDPSGCWDAFRTGWEAHRAGRSVAREVTAGPEIGRDRRLRGCALGTWVKRTSVEPARRSATDDESGTRFTLEGMTLTITRPPPGVRGKRVGLSCFTDAALGEVGPDGKTDQDARVTTARGAAWPLDRPTLTVRLPRDLSTRARSCFLEDARGNDVTGVRFCWKPFTPADPNEPASGEEPQVSGTITDAVQAPLPKC